MPTEIVREMSSVTAGADSRPASHAGEQPAKAEVTTCREPDELVPGDGKVIELAARRAGRAQIEVGVGTVALRRQGEVATIASPVSGSVRPIELRAAQPVRPVQRKAAA